MFTFQEAKNPDHFPLPPVKGCYNHDCGWLLTQSGPCLPLMMGVIQLVIHQVVPLKQANWLLATIQHVSATNTVSMRDLLIAGRTTAPASRSCPWLHPSTISMSTNRVDYKTPFQALCVDYVCSLHETSPCGKTHRVLFKCWIHCGCSAMHTEIKLFET